MYLSILAAFRRRTSSETSAVGVRRETPAWLGHDPDLLQCLRLNGGNVLRSRDRAMMSRYWEFGSVD